MLDRYHQHHIDPTLVGIGVVDHESCPLRHLTEMPEGVVEVLDRRDVGLRRQVERVLQSCEVCELACLFVIRIPNLIQRSKKWLVRGLVKFVPAVAYLL